MKNFKSQKTQFTQRKVRFGKRKISKKRPKNTPFFPKFPPKISPGERGSPRSNFEDFPPKNTPGAPARIGKKYFFSRKNHDFFKFLKIRGSGETVLFCVRSSLKIFKNSVFFENFDENLMKNLRKMGENLRAGKHRGSPENLRSNFAFLPPEKPPKNPRKTPIFTRIFPDFCSKKSTVCCRILWFSKTKKSPNFDNFRKTPAPRNSRGCPPGAHPQKTPVCAWILSFYPIFGGFGGSRGCTPPKNPCLRSNFELLPPFLGVFGKIPVQNFFGPKKQFPIANCWFRFSQFL